MCSACGTTILAGADVAGAVPMSGDRFALACEPCWQQPGIRKAFETLAKADEREQEAIAKATSDAYPALDDTGMGEHPDGIKIGDQLEAKPASIASGWQGDHGTGW
jgi:hypothetical protein